MSVDTVLVDLALLVLFAYGKHHYYICIVVLFFCKKN